MLHIPCIIGFHCNDKYRCKEFLENSKVIISFDKDYLGYGMYFWDNKSNAEYWLTQKKRKHPEIEDWCIVSAVIQVALLLDLTDHEELEKFDQLWQKYCMKTRTKKFIPLGKKIDILFEFFDLANKYYVIKANVPYNNIKDPQILSGSRVRNNSRIMYSVRKESTILNSKLEIEEKVC